MNPGTDQFNSIEADVVIIASCIPILHPLLEIITGKRTLASTKSYSQNYYADGSQANRSRGRRPTTSKNMSSSAIMDSVLREDDADSQNRHLIRRTDDVQIQYEMQGMSVQEPPKSLPRATKERDFR